MTDGYLLTFFTQLSRHHNGQPMARWIMQEASKIGIRGATMSTADEGFGHDGRYHSNDFFDMQDPPQKIFMAVTQQECEELLSLFKASGEKIFFTKTEISFGFTSDV